MTQTVITKVLIIGAGAGGYVAGIRCGQLGLDTHPHSAHPRERGDPVLWVTDGEGDHGAMS